MASPKDGARLRATAQSHHRELPWWCSGLSLQVQSLVRELRSHMLRDTAKKRGKNRSGDQNTGRTGPGKVRNKDKWGWMEAGVRQEEGVAFDMRLQSSTVQDLVSRSTPRTWGGAVQEASSLLSSNSERRQDQCVDGGRGGREVGGGNRARSRGPVSPGKGWAKGVALFFHEVDYSFFFFPE